MAITVARLQAVLAADTGQFDKAMDQSQSKMGKVSKAAGIAGAAIVGGLAVGMKKSVDAARESEKAQVSLESSLKSANISYKVHGKAIDEAIQKTSKLAALDDEDLSESFSKLVRTTKDVKQATDGMSLAANIARARHISLSAATKAVERAYNDSDAALKRFGISVPKVTTASDQMKKRVDELRDSLKGTKGATREAIEAQIDQAKFSLRQAAAIDKHATAQNSIAAAQKQFAGAAEAYGKSGAGAQERMQVAVENLEESMGTLLLPMITTVSTAVAKAAEFFTEHEKIAKVLVITIGSLGGALLVLSGIVKVATAIQVIFNSVLFANPIGLIILALVAFGAALVVAYKKSETFRNIVDGALDVVKKAFDAVKTAIDKVIDAFEWVRDHGGIIIDVLSKHPAWIVIKEAFEHIDTAWGFVKDAFVFIRDKTGAIIDALANNAAWATIKDAIGKVHAGLDKVQDAFVWLRDHAGDAVKLLLSGITKPLDDVYDGFNKVWGVIDKIIDGIKWLADKAGGAIGAVGGVLKKLPFGDASNASMGLPGALAAVTGGDATINPALWDELATARSYGLMLTSGYRPGAVTKHGTPSDHGQFPSKAIDVAGPAASMAAFFMSLIGNKGVKQAFYDPLGSIFGGFRSAYREGGHSDHVHVATYDRGGFLRPGWNLAYNGLGRPEPVGGGNVTIPVSIGGEHIATVVWDQLRQRAKVFENRNGRKAF